MHGVYHALLTAARGDANGLDQFISAFRDFSAGGNLIYNSLYNCQAGWRAFELGRNKQARAFASSALEFSEKTGETFFVAEVYRLEGHLAIAENDSDRAQASLNKAISIARGQGAKVFELRAAVDLARHYCSLGRINEAGALLAPFQESVADGDCEPHRSEAVQLLGTCRA